MKLDEYNFGDYLYERDYWIVFLSPNQGNLGSCVVVLKRREEFLGNIREEEWIELRLIIKELERAVKKAFGATLFNWGFLMNTFYRKNSPPPWLHCHFIPRYDHKVEVNGEIFEDPYFGYMRPWGPIKISRRTREIIKEKILENIR
ncbi:MAG: HIT family protein [Methanothermobacter sp.]|nr:HIT family protein [Methanothermobacter sp.]